MDGNLSDPRFLQFFRQMYGQMEKSEAEKKKRLQEMLSLTTQQLGSTLGSKMGRMNVPVAGGWENVANRFMGPLGTQMEAGLQDMPWEDMVNRTMGLSQMMFPMYQTFKSPRVDWRRLWSDRSNDFTNTFFG